MENRKGFTLVELVIVLAILALLIAIAIPNAIATTMRSVFIARTKPVLI